jgi:putative Holliday junction resolvase
MRKLGIDYGTKKIGLAMTDEAGNMAFPHEVVPNNQDFVAKVLALIEQKAITEIIIGHSLDGEGKENEVHQAVKDFMTDLTLQTPIPIHLEPEQFSTQQATKLQGKNDQTDASAAAIILQSYLDKQKTSSAFDELNQ